MALSHVTRPSGCDTTETWEGTISSTKIPLDIYTSFDGVFQGDTQRRQGDGQIRNHFFDDQPTPRPAPYPPLNKKHRRAVLYRENRGFNSSSRLPAHLPVGLVRLPAAGQSLAPGFQKKENHRFS